LTEESRHTESNDPRVEVALREFLERVDRGEPLDREQFLAGHARIAEQLRAAITAEEDVRKPAEAETPPDSAHDSTKLFAAHGQETIVPQSVGKQSVEAETGVTGLSGQFGRYRILRALGKGAMGTVYLAEDTHIERQVALKSPHFTEDPTGSQTERFFREARSAGNLRHPNICPIYDFGQIDGKHFITMAYIEGRPLSALIQPGKPQSERKILIAIRKLALALQAAHDKGIVHRDLKPANIMVDTSGEPIIMDFGLARQASQGDDIRLTQTGNILGTPAFMSPEQVKGEPGKIGPPTDQYSLGVILYELLTAQLPFRGSVMAVMGQILTKEPSPPSQLRADLDVRIEAVCLKMMAKNPSERFRSLKAAADEISSILKSPAAKTASKEQPASSPAPSPTGDRVRADAGASQVLKSLKQKTLSEKDLESLEELARKCYSRRDFEQVIQIIERVPVERRNAGLQALLEKSRGKVDEISFLIRDIDEADRVNDAPTALKTAEALLKVQPGHHQALKVRQKYSGYGKGAAARIGPLWRFTQPWNKGGWIPRKLVAFGLVAFATMACVVVIYVHKTAIVIDTQDQDQDPNVVVSVDGTKVEITGSTTKVVQEPPSAPAPRNTGPLPPTFKNSIGMGFVLVPKGTFWMGGRGGKPGVFQETITDDFYLGKHLVTQGQWKTVMGESSNLSFFSRNGGAKNKVKGISDADLEQFPVEMVSWRDAQIFIKALNSLEKSSGSLYRLPTEAEWEYACRGGATSKEECAFDYYLHQPTNDLSSEYANFDGKFPGGNAPKGHFLGRTCKVGSYAPNRLGLYDMHGNVCEWCVDPYTAGHCGVVRGGSWHFWGRDLRAAYRWPAPKGRNGDLGLRVVRVPPAPRSSSSRLRRSPCQTTLRKKSPRPPRRVGRRYSWNGQQLHYRRRLRTFSAWSSSWCRKANHGWVAAEAGRATRKWRLTRTFIWASTR
jgi:serine/threonine protein kinase/formylglycine-generating enzyme required for sulfatase activity